ncbi:Uncharacterised protein [Klebsiella pneumoniae]|nr:Uncharacterised protein [Klebsiella pneumoniae]
MNVLKTAWPRKRYNLASIRAYVTNLRQMFYS